MFSRADSDPPKDAPRPLVAPRKAPAPPKPTTTTAVVLVACALLGTSDVRALVIALGGALLALGIPAAARWPAALLIGWGMQRGGWPMAAAVVAMGAAVVSWPRPGTVLRRALVALATCIAAYAATRNGSVALGALASAAVLLAPLEDGVPRPALSAALCIAALPGAWGAYSAYTARAEARRTGDDAAWGHAGEACENLGWNGCVEDARVARALLARKSGDDAGALAQLDAVREPARAETELLHADVELALGKRGPAQARLARLARARPDAHAALSPELALAWARALDRENHREEAFAALDGVQTIEAARLRALLRPEDASLVAALGTAEAADVCLRAQLTKSADAARACLEKLPDHAPSLAILGKPLPGDAPTDRDESFGGALRLTRGASPTACLKRGEVPPIRFTWQVEDGFSADEGYFVFVHAVGPSVLGFDHLPGGREVSTLIPGERFTDALTAPIPASAPPGHYEVMVGLYAPGSMVRLQPRSQPTHITFVDAASFEVCP